MISAVLRVLVWLLSWMPSFQWLMKELLSGEDSRESVVNETYFDASDMQPRATDREARRSGGAPDLEAEVRWVTSEINARPRELQESILQERAVTLKMWGLVLGILYNLPYLWDSQGLTLEVTLVCGMEWIWVCLTMTHVLQDILAVLHIFWIFSAIHLSSSIMW